MKNNKTLFRNLRRWALLPLCAVGALLLTPQDARAVASVSNISISSSPGTDGYYEGGDTIQVYVQFSSPAFRDLTKATPRIKVTTGTRERTAYYKSGSSTTQWYFDLTVGYGSISDDQDGIEIVANSLAHRSSIRDSQWAGVKAANLAHNSYSFPNHKVDTLDPTISSISITSSAGSDSTYKKGEKIQASVTLSEKVKVTGTPRLTLNIGGTNRNASYTSGSNSKTLVFEYTIATGDLDTDGISIAANQLSLNGGTIKDGVSNTATLTHDALDTQSSHKVEAIAPTVRNLTVATSAGSDNTYKKGDDIQIRVAFSESVTVTGTPQLTLNVGGANRTANRTGGYARAQTFVYTVAANDTDTDGISIAANQLSLNGGTITDEDGNAATLTHAALGTQSSHKVDGVVPTVSSVAMSSTATNNYYKAGDKIQVQVTFSKNVNVTGTPQVTLTIGSSSKTANFKSVNSSNLVFEYTVATGDLDTDGISIAANQLSLNSGTIKDAVGNPATLTHTALGTQASHKVDGVVSTVSTVAISSSAGTDNTYKAGDKVQVTVTFSESVTVTGTPQVTLAIGSDNKTANYESGTGSAALVFAYTVVAGDTDTDGISIAANQLSLNGGTIEDTVGNAATLTHTALGSQASHKVDTTAPTVSTVAISSSAGADNAYKAGDTLQVQVTFSETVRVITGTPQMTVDIGGVSKTASYTSGTGTPGLVFAYTVVAGDMDTDGISIVANQLTLNGGTIQDIAGNLATLTHTALGTQASHKVDTTAPTIVEDGISLTSTTATLVNDTYKIGDTLQGQVTFSENVYVTGTPQLALKIGTASRAANYIGGATTPNLIFRYTVAAGDVDTDGIEIQANQFSLNGGTIQDIAANPATLTHTPLGTQVLHKVDGGVPSINPNGVDITSTPPKYNTYTTDEIIQVTLTFSEPVTVTGTPQLTLKVGTDDKTANYKSGSGTANLVFEYTVTADDEDTDGIAIQADQLERNGSTITDSVGNPATLTHTALPTQPYHKVEAIAPTISVQGTDPFTSTARKYSTYQEDETIEVTLAFSETVYVTGTPQFILKIGTADKAANYTGGSATKKLAFAYKVATGDEDTDGIGFDANQLILPDTTVTITDLFGNAAILTHPTIPWHPLHKVDAVLPHVKPNGIAITSSVGSDNIYTEGEKVEVTLTFNETVTVINTPQLTLKIGNQERTAEYMTGTGTAKLMFEYTIDIGDGDADGIEIQANKLSMNNGTIRDIVGNTAILTHAALPAQPDHKVDAVSPRLTTDALAVTSTSGNNYYRQGATLQVTATFNEKVTVTGTPTLGITIGMSNRSATYRSGSGTTKLLFEYTVANGDMDTDGISILANQITVPVNATLQDTAGNTADVTHRALDTQPAHKVDGIVPTVAPKGLAITSTPNSNNTYTKDETLQVQVTFTENVVVTNTPQVTLKIGANDRTADYKRGTGTRHLVFEYTVASTDTDTDGIEIEANKLSANNGTIKDVGGNTASLTHAALTPRPTHKVDGTTTLNVIAQSEARAATAQSGQHTRPSKSVPRVSGLAMTSTAKTYKANDKVQVTVSFSESVTVSGTPQVTLKIGAAEKKANWTSGSPGTTLVFSYTVVPGDTDTDGIEIAANQLSGTIKSTDDQAPANLNHNALPMQASHTVDTTLPTVSGIKISSSPSKGVIYKAGDTVQVTVSLSESVKVSGTPQVMLKVGGAHKTAGYTSGTGTPTLVFAYTVVAGDTDTDGISMDAIQRNGGTINDQAGNAATLTGAALTDQADHKVDTTAPSITSIAVTSTPGSHNAYQAGEKIQLQVSFSESVEVTDTPQVTLKIGTAYPNARYTGGTNTPALLFTYTVVAEDTDTDGISIDSNQLSGTIRDAAGNAADLTNTRLPTQSGHKVGAVSNILGGSDPVPTTVPVPPIVSSVQDTSDNTLNPNPPALPDQGPTQQVDTTAPQVSSVAFTSTGPYSVGSAIHVTVTTNEVVTVTGSPSVTLVIGSTERTASYLGGTGSTALVFGYTVTTADTKDTGGVSLKANSLVLNDGTILDTAGNTLNLTHSGVLNGGDMQVLEVPVSDLNLSHASLPADTEPIVDTVQPVMTADPKQGVASTHPVITGIAFAEDAPAVYTAGSTVEILLTFAETGVKVTPDESGTLPSLSLLFGANADPDSQKTVVTASYKEARPGSTKLVFTYPVTAETPIDTDGVQIKQGSLNIPAGAAITDANENPIEATPSEDGGSLVDIKPASRLSSRPILPALTSGGIIFNEFLNAKTDKHDWVELRNTMDTEISLGGWKLNISAGNTTQTEIVAFPDMTLPGGAVLLLVNTAHKETHLEHSDAATYRSLKIPELRLRGTDFSLILRDRFGAIVDVVSNYASDTEGAETPIGFASDTAYLREQPNTLGYEAAAWQPSGYQGSLGYTRKAPKETSLGTPGYLQSPLVPQGQTAPVSISEVMFTTGTSGRLPQWIELYNASKTEVVTLQDWHLHVEVADPMRQPMHRFMTFRIQRPLRILPKQTVLVVAKNGRNSQHFPEHRLYTLTAQNPEAGAHLQPDVDLLGDYGYAIVLRDASGTQIDIAGNLDGNSNTREAPRWKLPNCITANGFRSSIIRQYEEGAPLTGTHKSSWFRATEIRRQIVTYYGHPKDVGNPGWKKGGPLPVQLSSFKAERTEQGALLQWTTASELENAGFNLLRSETKAGPFQVVTPRMLQGAGTTSERSTYTYVDTTAKENVAYYYRLEEVSFSGVQQPVATRRLRGHVSAANRHLTTFGSLKKGE